MVLMALLCSVLCFNVNLTYSQNLVPNPGFEEIDGCTVFAGYAEVDSASYWFNPTWTTPDLRYDSCLISDPFYQLLNLVDQNILFPGAHNGQGYVGMILGSADYQNHPTSTDWMEYISVKLTSSLVAGQHYYVSAFIKLQADVDYATEDLGFYFSETSIADSTLEPLKQYIPQVSNLDGFITNTGEWKKVTGCFIANGGEEYLTIGNFSDPGSANLLHFTGDTSNKTAYYFIDDISVEPISFDFDFDSLACSYDNQTIEINPDDSLFYYFPNASITYDSLGIDPFDSLHKFQINTIEGNCIITDTARVKIETAGDIGFSNDTTICQGDTFVLKSSFVADAYTWSTGSIADTIEVFDQGTYSLTVTKGPCTVSDTIIVSTMAPPTEVFQELITVCHSESVLLDASTPLSTYLWSDGSMANSLLVNSPGLYWVEITNQCGTTTDNVEVSFNELNPENVPNTITPNGDGINDKFSIPLTESCALKFVAFNRWGSQIYENDNYQGQWPVNDLSDGIYYYEIHSQESDCTVTGWIQVLH